jgi:hypothetical protein
MTWPLKTIFERDHINNFRVGSTSTFRPVTIVHYNWIYLQPVVVEHGSFGWRTRTSFSELNHDARYFPAGWRKTRFDSILNWSCCDSRCHNIHSISEPHALTPCLAWRSRAPIFETMIKFSLAFIIAPFSIVPLSTSGFSCSKTTLAARHPFERSLTTAFYHPAAFDRAVECARNYGLCGLDELVELSAGSLTITLYWTV